MKLSKWIANGRDEFACMFKRLYATYPAEFMATRIIDGLPISLVVITANKEVPHNTYFVVRHMVTCPLPESTYDIQRLPIIIWKNVRDIQFYSTITKYYSDEKLMTYLSSLKRVQDVPVFDSKVLREYYEIVDSELEDYLCHIDMEFGIWRKAFDMIKRKLSRA